MLRKSFFIPLTILSTLLLAGCGRTYNDVTHNWDDEVKEYLDNNYKGVDIDYNIGGEDDGTEIYNCTVHGEIEFKFKVKCYFYSYVDFFVPATGKRIKDNFGEVFGKYISDEYGKYNITGKTLDDMVSYVMEVRETSKEIAKDYSIGQGQFAIQFIFFDANDVQIYEQWNNNEETIREQLQEIFPDK